jgi:hypothetical protein
MRAAQQADSLVVAPKGRGSGRLHSRLTRRGTREHSRGKQPLSDGARCLEPSGAPVGAAAVGGQVTGLTTQLCSHSWPHLFVRDVAMARRPGTR